MKLSKIYIFVIILLIAIITSQIVLAKTITIVKDPVKYSNDRNLYRNTNYQTYRDHLTTASKNNYDKGYYDGLKDGISSGYDIGYEDKPHTVISKERRNTYTALKRYRSPRQYITDHPQSGVLRVYRRE